VNTLLKTTFLVALTATGAPQAFALPPKTEPAKPAPAHSVFVMPANPREGRDPFFPESPRPYEESVTATNRTEANAIVIKGLSVEHGRAMVIINNHTFAVGDEGDVLTSGNRVHLHLVEIRADVAVIEINGSRREIGIPNK